MNERVSGVGVLNDSILTFARCCSTARNMGIEPLIRERGCNCLKSWLCFWREEPWGERTDWKFSSSGGQSCKTRCQLCLVSLTRGCPLGGGGPVSSYETLKLWVDLSYLHDTGMTLLLTLLTQFGILSEQQIQRTSPWFSTSWFL